MRKKISLRQGFAIAVVGVFVLLLGGCRDKKQGTAEAVLPDAPDEAMVADSALYGSCGEGTTMNLLELLTDAGDTLRFVIDDAGDDVPTVMGGMLVGDRMTVVAGPTIDGDRYADKVVNLTTLQGKWTSLDKNFEIEEGGVVRSDVKAETNPWTSWKMLNGQLLLNRDTFSINALGNDTLALENGEGIFVYKRH